MRRTVAVLVAVLGLALLAGCPSGGGDSGGGGGYQISNYDHGGHHPG
jgi:hypothetical protein